MQRKSLAQFGLIMAVAGVAAMSPASAATDASAPTPSARTPAVVDPYAIDALNKMGAYLRTLTSFEIQTETATDAVLDNNQRIEIDGTSDYKVRRPNAFVITMTNPRKAREFYYDGKSLTIYAPRMKLYTTVSAPPTIREMFDTLSTKYKTEVPLEDLFHWGLPEEKHDFTSAGVVGFSKIGGVDADQYAFREGDIDWQIWIQRGAKPLPLKLVIDKTSDVSVPRYSAELHWDTDTTFPDSTFAFNQPPNAKAITIASAKP